MIIPAAGYGTRMQILTKGGSKEILETGGRPALMFALQEALAAGIDRVGIVIRQGKDDIVRTVQDDTRLSPIREKIDIDIFYQARPTGEAGAIHTAAAWLGSDPFVVHYPDNIIAGPPGTLAELIERQGRSGLDLVLLTAMLDHAHTPPCGLKPLGSGLYRLLPNEKPPKFPYGLRPTGIYIATHRFLAACQDLLLRKKSGEVKDRDARCHLVKQDHEIHGVDLSVKVLDIGNPGGYRLSRDALKKRA
jgi:UTP-glucose-1-phosphate uridylyltransferase